MMSTDGTTGMRIDEISKNDRLASKLCAIILVNKSNKKFNKFVLMQTITELWHFICDHMTIHEVQFLLLQLIHKMLYRLMVRCRLSLFKLSRSELVARCCGNPIEMVCDSCECGWARLASTTSRRMEKTQWTNQCPCALFVDGERGATIAIASALS